MTTLSDYLKAVEERCEKATEGPWKLDNGRFAFSVRRNPYSYTYSSPLWRKEAVRTNLKPMVCNIPKSKHTNGVATANFIAHSRTDVPLLVKILKKAVEALFELKRNSRGIKVHYAGENNKTQGLDLLFSAQQALAELEEMVR